MNKYYPFVLIFVIVFFIITSCAEKKEFNSLVYRSGGFGIENYHLILNHDRSFALKVEYNPLTADSTNVGTFKGKISPEQMEKIEKAVAKITKKGYDYNDPEFVLDAGNYEVIINIDKSIKVYNTNNATDEFYNDIITPLNQICERILTAR
ncbi:hypothetical protein [Riemerella anatipestifer]|nr:hypothetical protein [Riemerella anatipestifer]MBT0549954.1 hypothetical protein [Riemerella anatipestifer]MBT0556776.1 hypothetical protein [Riemerella anatipestifer]MBT0560740.1 hypothetical protein [Riemerella anatipestifer]MCD5968318.1 hypothetical protein [Riemerella anatipestifer]MCO7352391.1 hypothetical protein [Riemerella anatipestifer]